jgi:hypothetical protein
MPEANGTQWVSFGFSLPVAVEPSKRDSALECVRQA